MEIEISALKPHEQIGLKRYREILLEIATYGKIHPIIIDKNTHIVLDGHHRLEAMKTLGYKTIPVYEVDMMDPRIEIEWAYEGYDNDAKKIEVRYQARMGNKYPEKTTKFMYRLDHGTTVRLCKRFPNEMLRVHLL